MVRAADCAVHRPALTLPLYVPDGLLPLHLVMAVGHPGHTLSTLLAAAPADDGLHYLQSLIASSSKTPAQMMVWRHVAAADSSARVVVQVAISQAKQPANEAARPRKRRKPASGTRSACLVDACLQTTGVGAREVRGAAWRHWLTARPAPRQVQQVAAWVAVAAEAAAGGCHAHLQDDVVARVSMALASCDILAARAHEGRGGLLKHERTGLRGTLCYSRYATGCVLALVLGADGSLIMNACHCVWDSLSSGMRLLACQCCYSRVLHSVCCSQVWMLMSQSLA